VCEDRAGPGVRINRAGFATQGLPGTCDMALVHWSPLASRLLKPASSSIICHSSKRSHVPCRRRLVRPRRGGHSAWGRAEQGKGSAFKASTRDVRIRSVDSPSIWRTLKNPEESSSLLYYQLLSPCVLCLAKFGVVYLRRPRPDRAFSLERIPGREHMHKYRVRRNNHDAPMEPSPQSTCSPGGGDAR